MEPKPAPDNPFKPPAAVVVEMTAQRERMPRSVAFAQVPVLLLYLASMAAGLESVQDIPPWQAAAVLAAVAAIVGVPFALLLLGLRLRRTWVWWTAGAIQLAGSGLLTWDVFVANDQGWRFYLHGDAIDNAELALCPTWWLSFALWMMRSARAWFRKPAPATAEPVRPASR